MFSQLLQIFKCQFFPWLIVLFIYLAMPWGMQDLTLTRYQTCDPCRKKILQILLKPYPTSLSPLSLLNGCHHPEEGIHYFNECFYTFISYVSCHKQYLSLLLQKGLKVYV